MLDEHSVLLVVGTGAMGLAAVRRCGSGRRIVLADIGTEALSRSASALDAEGHDVTTVEVDVADGASVDAMAKTARELGSVAAIVHTAGVSPVQASAERVVDVDLLGVAHMLHSFESVVAPGSAAVVVSSMAGHLAPPPSPEDELAIARATVEELRSLPRVAAAAAGDPGFAYAFAKRAVAIRVAAASVAWGRHGARVNAISPGIIATPMGRAELASASGQFMRQMVASSGIGRLGTPDDIAAATDFLLSPQSSFVTGTDLLVDGGAVAAVRSGQLTSPGETS